MTRSVSLPAALVAAGLSLVPASLGATEFGATHLVLEKATPMKRVAASLYMSVVDRSVRGDRPGNRRRLRCAVAAMGKRGSVPAGGAIVLRLQGAAGGGSAAWQGSKLTEPLDRRGEAEFADDAILDLVDEASAEGAEPELFRIEFDGGKGKKVNGVTVDCIHQPADG